ncbi:MAG TPA: formyltransferase family protein [Pseudolabrys sp.]|nr:formyltransferase family protein [Pseudolabrys sp.]
MLDAIILLTGPAEAPALAAALRGHNPQLDIRHAVSLPDLVALEPEFLRRARLIAFTTPVVVPAAVLDQLGHGAYNFHPGPPHFPGWAPAHFAIYQRATEFGATVHVMIEQVDAGPIVGADLFDVPPGSSVNDLETMAFVRLARLFWGNAKSLATQTSPLAELPIRWSGRKTMRHHYAAMCDIPPDISKDELARRVAVFGRGDFGVHLTTTLHGIQFNAVAKDAALLPAETALSAHKKQDRAA